MAGSAVLAVRIFLDARKAIKELDKTAEKAGKFGGSINKAAAVAGVGLGALAGYAAVGVKAAADDQRAQVALAQTLKKTAGATDASIASTEDWIAKTSLATGVADDDLRPALAQLVRATGNVGQAQDALSAAMDISATTGKDVTTVAAALAKGYKGNAGAIGKLGLGIDKTTIKANNMGLIMGDVANITGGAAAAAADTAAGKLQRMHVAFSETQETLGAIFLPLLTQLLGILQPILASFSQNAAVMKILVLVFGTLGAAVLVVIGALKVQAFWTQISTEGTITHTAASKAAAAASKAWAAAQWLVNAAIEGNPIGLIIIAVIALVAAIVIAYKRSDTFRRIVDGAFRAVLRIVQTVWHWIAANWPLLLAILTGPIGVATLLVVKNLGTIKRIFRSVFSAIKGFIQPVIDAVQSLMDLIGKVIDKIGKIKIPHLPDLNPFKAAPSVASASTTRGATAGTTSRTRDGGNVINVYAVDPQQTARLIQRLTHTADVRGGRKRFA